VKSDRWCRHRAPGALNAECVFAKRQGISFEDEANLSTLGNGLFESSGIFAIVDTLAS